VVPIYNEEKNIIPLYEELKKVFSKLSEYDFEIIFVDDGSVDGSVMELNKLTEKDNQIRVLSFSRNFGKEAATSAGCHHSKGDAVITMDADLQHPPELIPEFIKKWKEGFEVIYTVRQENKGASFTKKITSKIYWWMFNKVSSVESEPHSTDFRLMDKMVINTFKKFSERERLFRGIIDWMGYKRARLEFTAPKRNSGKAAYSYAKLVNLAINSLTAFSMIPLRLAGYFGIVITSISSLILIIMFLTKWFINAETFTALAFVVVANTLLIGIVLISLGLIALYIARIHDEVVNRPLYVIRDKFNIESENNRNEQKN